jgi:hypothetical protein
MEPEEGFTQVVLVTFRARKPAMMAATACGALTKRNSVFAGIVKNGTI